MLKFMAVVLDRRARLSSDSSVSITSGRPFHVGLVLVFFLSLSAVQGDLECL